MKGPGGGARSLRVKRIALVGGPLVAAIVFVAMRSQGFPSAPSWTAAITVLCGAWWVLEPVPMPVTALIPFAGLPLAGVLSHREVAQSYGHTLVLLMLAGSMVGSALEKSGGHKRLALGMVRIVGGSSGSRLVLGFLLAAAVLSMWISNTATVVMLLPVAMAVLGYHDDEDRRRLTVPLLLALAYGGALGGTATPIGTPPNLILISQYELATGNVVSFSQWMGIGLPLVLVMVPVVWLWLVRHMREIRTAALPRLGPWRSDERRVLFVFGLTALAWMTRSGPFGGWQELIGAEGTAGDSTVALAAVVALFLVPSGTKKGGALLDWATAVKIPWGVFIMIGGGMAIGQGFSASGLGDAIGAGLVSLTNLPWYVMVGLLCLFSTFLTEVTSNTAVANVLMPVLAAVGLAADLDPWWLMVPATLGLNWAFMLPVATASNAIVYGTGEVSTRQMAREGFALNLMGAVLITAVSKWLVGA